MDYTPSALRPSSPLPTLQNTIALTGTNGVPLGGIGAGCLDMLPDGRLANFCMMNNWHRQERIETMPGSFLAVAIDDGHASSVHLLQSASTLPLGLAAPNLLLRPEAISYYGLYPSARLGYDLPNPSLQLEMHARGPVVPGDPELAALPAALFTVSLKNRGVRTMRVCVGFSWENIAGCTHGVFPDGRDRMELLRSGKAVVGIRFPSPPGAHPNQAGEHVLQVAGPPGSVASAARYNTWDAGIILSRMQDDHGFTSTQWENPYGEPGRTAAMLACSVTLEPGGTAEVTFALAWHYPRHVAEKSYRNDREWPPGVIGHRYSKRFRDAGAVADQVLEWRGRLDDAITAWHRRLLDSSLPGWLAHMAINSLYVLSPCTLWAEDGRFALMETPYGPMMGTLDQRFYSSVATALFFPELERSELAMFGQAVNPLDHGRVYHDLGNLRLDIPLTGTTTKRWTDLNPKYVLMAIRNARWTGDRLALEQQWEGICAMMAYTISQDTDGDGIPDNEDRSTTYDDWAFFGASSYVAVIWLAALAAFREAADWLDRPQDWAPYQQVEERARISVEQRLWDAKYGHYRLYNDDRNPVFSGGAKRTRSQMSEPSSGAVNQGRTPDVAMDDHPEICRDCHDGQLAGQWYADLLGLGDLLDPQRIDSAIEQIFKRNSASHGLRKGVDIHGHESANPMSSGWWSEAGMSWPGYEVAHFSALAIHRGRTTEGLAALERIYRSVYERARLTWNQPLRWDPDTGTTYGWGCDRYMNSPAVWHAILALVGVFIDRDHRRIRIAPRMAMTRESHLPVFSTGNWGTLTIRPQHGGRCLELRLSRPEPVVEILVEAGDGECVEIPHASCVREPDSHRWKATFTEIHMAGSGSTAITIATRGHRA